MGSPRRRWWSVRRRDGGSEGRADRFLQRVRGLGVDIAVDDFGTGFSCMAYLHNLPVSILKIDRSFTQRMLQDVRTGIIVASTIDMAHHLDLSVVAEGVETQEQLSWLGAHGCDHVQGYLTGRPMAADQLHAWLSGHTAARTSAGTGVPLQPQR